MGTGPPSKLVNETTSSSSHLGGISISISSSISSSSGSLITMMKGASVTDPFQKDGRRGSSSTTGGGSGGSRSSGTGCVRSAMPKFKLPNIITRNSKKKIPKLSVLMKLVFLKDWQRVLIRSSLFPNEVEDVCVIPLFRPTPSSSPSSLLSRDTHHPHHHHEGDRKSPKEEVDEDNVDVLWIKVLPIHVACTLQPPEQVISALLSNEKKNAKNTKDDVIVEKSDQMEGKIKKGSVSHRCPEMKQHEPSDSTVLDTTMDGDAEDCFSGHNHAASLAGTAIEAYNPSNITGGKKGRHGRRHHLKKSTFTKTHGDTIRRRHFGPQRKQKLKFSSSFQLSKYQHEISYKTNTGYDNGDNGHEDKEQRHDEEELGCRLLDDNACHMDHFERERIHVEQQLATNGRGTSAMSKTLSTMKLGGGLSRSSSSSFSHPRMNKDKSGPMRKLRQQSSQRQSLAFDDRMIHRSDRNRSDTVLIEGVKNMKHTLQMSKSKSRPTDDSCQMSLEASIGDGATDDGASERSGSGGHKVRKQDETLIDNDDFYHYHEENKANLPMDGWSSYSSIQFVDEDTDDERFHGGIDTNVEDDYEYYEACGADYDVELNSDPEKDTEDALLNQFLDEQGIILQLIPGGEIQPMPIQESRKTVGSKTKMNHSAELESVNESDSTFFSLTSPSGSDPQTADTTSTGDRTASLDITPLDLWESLKFGEDCVLPIHIACLYNASTKILQTLLSDYPDGALVGVLGLLPIHMVAMGSSLPDLPLGSNESGGNSDIYSLLQEQLDPASQDSGTWSGESNGTSVGHSDFLIGRVKALIEASPKTLFAKSVSHTMRPQEYSLHFANVQQSPQNVAFTKLNSFLQDKEESRLKLHPPSKDTTTSTATVNLSKQEDIPCGRTQSSSTCSTVASSLIDALLVKDRNNLQLSSSSSSSCLSAPVGLSDLLRRSLWSDAIDMLESDLRLARKWSYGIDHGTTTDHRSVAGRNTPSTSACVLWKRLPLHIACASKDAPPIGLINLLVRAYRGAASSVDPHSGYTPLHLACRTHCDLNVIRALLQAAPVATKAVDRMLGQLPLHHAILSHAPYSVIETLVYHDPETVSFPDNAGKTPLMLAQRIYTYTNPTNIHHHHHHGSSNHSPPQNHPVLTLLELAWV